MQWFVVIYAVNFCTLLVVALRESRQPARGLVWLTLGLVVPILGPLIYFVLTHHMTLATSSNGPTRDRAPRKPDDSADLPADFGPAGDAMAHLLGTISRFAPKSAQVNLLPDGSSMLRSLASSLRSARRSIDMEYYIYREDTVGQTISGILSERAMSGIHVRFVVDGWGSRKFLRHGLKKLQAAGVECRVFFPIKFPWLTPRLNHRDHCKISTVDRSIAFVGGINIGDEYTGTKPGVGPWRDTHLQVRGEGVVPLQHVFNANWETATALGEQKHTRRQPAQRLRSVRRMASTWVTEFGRDGIADPSCDYPSHSVWVQTAENGPQDAVQSIRHLFFIAIIRAERAVDITTPYFLPDVDLITALKTSVLRGVRVRLLVPRHPDHPIVGWASRTYFEELLEAGVELYLHDHGVLHAKVMTVDNRISTVGAPNYDPRSFRLNFEVTEVIYGEELARELTAQFEADLRNAKRVSLSEFRHRSDWVKAVESGARLLAPLL